MSGENVALAIVGALAITGETAIRLTRILTAAAARRRADLAKTKTTGGNQ